MAQLFGRSARSFRLFLVFGCLFVVWTMFTLWWCSCESSDSDLLEEVIGGRNRFVRKHSFLTILILTAPKDEKRRNLIRETWLKGRLKVTQTVLHYFPVGVGIHRSCKNVFMELNDKKLEVVDKHTPLQLKKSHKESYGNLTGKILEAIVLCSHLNKFQYLLKVDDDSLVRIEALIAKLVETGSNRLYYGFLDGRAQWKEKEWNLCDRYLPHALGGGYVLAWELVQFIVSNKKLLRLYSNEDVAVGAWLAGLNVDYVHEPLFDTEYRSRGCFNQYLITHKQSESDIRSKWDSLQTTGKLCTEEVRLRRSYIYNWNVPPSQCCNRSLDLSVP